MYLCVDKCPSSHHRGPGVISLVEGRHCLLYGLKGPLVTVVGSRRAELGQDRIHCLGSWVG
jgi:hypothetical protein